MTKVEFGPQQVVQDADMGLLSSAPHKYNSFKLGIESHDPHIVATQIPIRKGAAEKDIPRPWDTAITKVQSFANQVDLSPVAKQLKDRATATTADVLFVAKDQVQTTDREGLGAHFSIAALGETLKNEAKLDRPGVVEIYCATGTARVSDLVKYRGNIAPELIYPAWEEGLMALSPGLIRLLLKPKKLFELHKLGVVGKGIINPRSISAIHWPELVRQTPQIARHVKGGRRDISIELKFGTHNSHYISADTTWESAERAACELEIMTRGIPPSLIPGIVGFYLQ